MKSTCRGPSPAAGTGIREGFTLIEVLVALVVVLFGFMASISAITGSIQSGKLAESQTLAVFLAETQMESIRYIDNEQLGQVGTTYFDQSGKQVANASQKYFQREVAVVFETPTIFTNEITVTVTWPGANPVVMHSLVPVPKKNV
ncbi:MAG: prepilin-type N-terminal cleavage/methylation domain-containing protein [Deltaproteobacteria bacterium]|jgi:type IV pilus assembly protein PilV|nr:prepilin-type N-terminal cleavage/methylation domain-containing protein [Deltaproteobacteria bacterium]